MAQVTERNNTQLVQTLRHFASATGAVKGLNRELDYSHTEMRTLLKDTSDLEDTLKKIHTLQKQRIPQGSGRKDTIEYVRALQSQYKSLLDNLSAGKKNTAQYKEATSVLKGLDGTLKRLEATSDKTWDSAAVARYNTELAKTAGQVDKVAKSMKNVHVDSMTTSFKKMGLAIDDAFGGDFMRKLSKIPGVAGAMKGHMFGQKVQKATGGMQQVIADRQQQKMRANAQRVYDAHGKAGYLTMKKQGYTGPKPHQMEARRGVRMVNPDGSPRRVTAQGRAIPGGARPQAAARAAAGAMDQMSVKTLVVGRAIIQGAGGGGAKAAAGGAASPAAGRVLHRTQATGLGGKPATRYNSETGALTPIMTPRRTMAAPAALRGEGGKKAVQQALSKVATKSMKDVATGGDASKLVDGAVTAFGKKDLLKKGLAGLKSKYSPLDPSTVAKTMKGSGGILGDTVKSVTGALTGKGAPGGKAGGIAALAQAATSQAGSGGGKYGQGALGMVGGLLGGVGKFLGNTTLTTLTGGLVDVRDKVAEENRKVNEALGHGGLMSGVEGSSEGVNNAFQNARRMMASTSFSTQMNMGQGVEKNLELFKSMTEAGGIAVGATANKEVGKGGVNLADEMEKRGGLGGSLYGNMMNNAVYLGKNSGMNQDQSVRLTLKLMNEFRMTTGETSKFFLHLDDQMKSSGMSASKYLEVVEAITGHFDAMNKSLNFTVGILNSLGKSGKLTGDQMKEVMGTLAAPNQMGTAQRAFNAMGMSQQRGDGTTMAGETGKGYEAMAKKEMDELNESLAKFGTKLNPDMGNYNDVRERINASQLDNDSKRQALAELQRKREMVGGYQAKGAAFNSGNPMAIASAMENMGEDPFGAMQVRRGNMLQVLRTAGVSGDDQRKLMGGDQDARKRVMADPRVGLMVSQLKKSGVLSGDFDLDKVSSATAQAQQVGAEDIIGYGREGRGIGANGEFTGKRRKVDANGKEIEGTTSEDFNRYQAIAQIQRARGKPEFQDKSEAELVRLFLAEARDPERRQGLTNDLTTGKAAGKVWDTTMIPGSPAYEAHQKDITNKALGEAKDKATMAADQMRPTAEVFANAFSSLFDKLINVLQPILRVLQFAFPSAGAEAKAQDMKDQPIRQMQASTVSDLMKVKEAGLTPQQLSDKKELEEMAKNGGDLSQASPETVAHFMALRKSVFSSGDAATAGRAAGQADAVAQGQKNSDAATPDGVMMGSAKATAWTNPLTMGLMAAGSSIGAIKDWWGDRSKVKGEGMDLKNMVGSDTPDDQHKQAMIDFATGRYGDQIKKSGSDGNTLLTAVEGTDAAKALKALADLLPNLLTTSRDAQGNVTYQFYNSNSSSARPNGQANQGTPPAKAQGK
jgi:hypothetical protein